MTNKQVAKLREEQEEFERIVREVAFGQSQEKKPVHITWRGTKVTVEDEQGDYE